MPRKPDKPNVRNKARRARAQIVIDAYPLAYDADEYGAGKDFDMATMLTDILADMFHWADGEGLDFEDAYRRAVNHHWCETTGGEP